MNGKDVGYYRSLPYSRRVRPEEDSDGTGYYVAWVEEVSWIRVDGPTREEALRRLDEAFADGIQVMIDAGDDIIEPARWPESVGHAPARPRKGIRRFGGSHSRKAAPPPETEVKTVSATSEEEWRDVDTKEVQTAGAGTD